MSEATLHLTMSATQAHLGNLELEKDFATLNDRAEEIKMKINAKKKQLLVVAPSLGNNTTALIKAGGILIEWVDSFKLAGFTFGRDPGVRCHVRAIEEKINTKIWVLYKLPSAGFKGGQLYRPYCCYLRSIIEYCLVIYHHVDQGAGNGPGETAEAGCSHMLWGVATPTTPWQGMASSPSERGG